MIDTYSIVHGQSEFAIPESKFQPGTSPGSLGDSYTAISDDPYATYYNPAGIFQASKKYQILLNSQTYTRFDENIIKQNPSYYIGGLWKIDDLHGVAISYNTYSLEGSDDAINNFNIDSQWFNIAVARKVRNNMGVGVGIFHSSSESKIESGTGSQLKQSAVGFSLGVLLNKLHFHPIIGEDIKAAALGLSLNGISNGVHSEVSSNSLEIVDEGDDPYPTNARIGLSTLLVNTNKMEVKLSFDIRKYFVDKDDDNFAKWLTPFITGWSSQDPTYHMGSEFRFPQQNFYIRIGRSYEEQFIPARIRTNYGFAFWYKSMETIITFDNMEFIFDELTISRTTSRIEINFGVGLLFDEN